MSPSFSTRAGPRGPSGVNTMFFPARASRIISRNASPPPRLDEPRAASAPNQRIVCAMISPSFDLEIITTIGFANRECSMSSSCECQKARMYCGVPVMFCARTCRTRSVAWSVRMNRAAIRESTRMDVAPESIAGAGEFSARWRSRRFIRPVLPRSPEAVRPRRRRRTAGRRVSGRRHGSPATPRASPSRRFFPCRGRRSCGHSGSSRGDAR